MRYLIIMVCLLFTGCSPFKTIETRIPIFVKKQTIKYDPEQQLPIKALNKQSTAPDVMKAYVKSIMMLKKDNQHLRAILDSQN